MTTTEINPQFPRSPQDILDVLYYLREGLEDMHPFFGEWLRQIEKRSFGEPDLEEEDLVSWRIHNGGRIVVGVHRNDFLHSHTAKLSRLSNDMAYDSNHVADLQHCYIPIYLPITQMMCKDFSMWNNLHMESYFPETDTYPRLVIK